MDAKSSELEITRELDAPRSLVFECWTTAAHLEKWFGPIGFTVNCTMDFRVGGKVSITMTGYGMVHTVHGVYLAIVPNERLDMSFRFEDVPDHELLQTITFAEHGGKTRVTVRHWFPTWDKLNPEQLAILTPRAGGARIGWGQTLQHLVDYVGTRKADQA